MRERERERDDLETKEEMKESGLLDLKALRKDHIVPMKGQPKSPGGNDNLFLSLNFNFSKYQTFTLPSTHFNPKITHNMLTINPIKAIVIAWSTT